MIILYETPEGYALFNKEDTEKKDIKLLERKTFNDNIEAFESFKKLNEGEIPENLNSFLSGHLKDRKDTLLVGDQKIVKPLSDYLKIKVHCDQNDVFREIRSNFNELLGIEKDKFHGQGLCLAHRLGTDKLKINPEKIDTMVIQAVTLLEDLDKDINLHCMRLREWYGFHFPELSEVIPDNLNYLKAVNIIERKELINEEVKKELSTFLEESKIEEIIKLAEISMGTEITEGDAERIRDDVKSVCRMFEYRDELLEYLSLRMKMIAPNLTALVGDLIGAKLLVRAGSLSNLGNCASSTIQLLGAEKALFHALKTKGATPKYGLIYHASLVGQSSPHLKGKISRILAAKISIASRVDMFSDKTSDEVGKKGRVYVEQRIKVLEAQSTVKKGPTKNKKNEYKPVLVCDVEEKSKTKFKK